MTETLTAEYPSRIDTSHSSVAGGRSWVLIAVVALTLTADLNGQTSGRNSTRSGQAPGAGGDWRSTERDDRKESELPRQQPAKTPPTPDDTAADDEHEPPIRRATLPAAREPTDLSDSGFINSTVTVWRAGGVSPPIPGRNGGLTPPARHRICPIGYSRIKNGQVWREYNLAPYTTRLVGIAHPEQAVVDWILKQTGPETWHGEDPAVLSASRGRLRVLHRPDVQAHVAEIVDRFTRPVQPQVSMRVQFITTSDLNWRSGLLHLLKPAAVGPDGQHVWLIAPEDLSLIRNRLKLDRQSGPMNQRVLANNGQSTTIETGQPVNYISGLDLDNGIYLAYQPIIARLNEGVKATFTPLWTTDGIAVDLEVKVSTRVVNKLHYAQSAVPLRSGSQETVVQVPAVSATSLEQTLNWPTSQVLLISAGVQPSKANTGRGPLNFSSGTAEVLILVELDPPVSARAATRRSLPANR